MKARGLEIQVESDDTFPQGRQESGGIGEKQRTPNAALVGIKGYCFHVIKRLNQKRQFCENDALGLVPQEGDNA